MAQSDAIGIHGPFLSESLENIFKQRVEEQGTEGVTLFYSSTYVEAAAELVGFDARCLAFVETSKECRVCLWYFLSCECYPQLVVVDCVKCLFEVNSGNPQG